MQLFLLENLSGWVREKNAADESNCFGLSGLFVVMSVHHCSEPLPRFQGGVLCSIMSAHGFPKTCHPEDEEATARYQIPITTWRKMMVLMFHTLMDRKKCCFMPILSGLALVQVLALTRMWTQRQNKSQRTTRATVGPQCEHHLNLIFFFFLSSYATQIWLFKGTMKIKNIKTFLKIYNALIYCMCNVLIYIPMCMCCFMDPDSS